jgi:hypothetical protein
VALGIGESNPSGASFIASPVTSKANAANILTTSLVSNLPSNDANLTVTGNVPKVKQSQYK